MSDLPENLRDGRYAVIRLLGEGGQAATFEAVDKKEGRPVAIKRFRVRGAKSWKEVELAEREARVLASLSHPGLPRYIEHFEEGGELFLVTEKVEGESLAAMQKRGATLSEADIVRFLRDASSILDYLHGRAPPVVHRDIKPSNVMRRSDGSFVLIDFGAVRDKLKPEGGSTVVGTFGYMAPEQFQGRAMPASDVYAVGATAITMLTGRQPEDLPHKGLAIDVAATLSGRASKEIVTALEAMLEPDPDRRAGRLAPLVDKLRAQEAPPTGKREDKREDKREAKRQDTRDKERERGLEHDVEHDIERGITDAVQQMEKTFSQLEREWSKSSQQRASKSERKAEQRATRAERRAERHARRAEKRARREAVQAALPGALAGLFLFGLTLAQIAVLVSLRALVPALLTVLSVFFGKGLREASRRVAAAGDVAHSAMERAKDAIRGRTGVAPTNARIAVDARGPREDAKRVRFDVDDDAAAEEEQRAEEEAAEEAPHDARSRRRG